MKTVTKISLYKISIFKYDNDAKSNISDVTDEKFFYNYTSSDDFKKKIESILQKYDSGFYYITLSTLSSPDSTWRDIFVGYNSWYLVEEKEDVKKEVKKEVKEEEEEIEVEKKPEKMKEKKVDEEYQMC